jgi:hypothetical protein
LIRIKHFDAWLTTAKVPFVLLKKHLCLSASKPLNGFLPTWESISGIVEELVAEIGSAFLCADLGLTPETREDHAAYISFWLNPQKRQEGGFYGRFARPKGRRPSARLSGRAAAASPRGPASRRILAGSHYCLRTTAYL